MKIRTATFAMLLFLLTACLGLPPRPTSVKLFDPDNKLVGFVDLIEIKGGVRFRVHTMGMPGGVRGFNIYRNPACEPPAFTSAGPVLTAPPGSRDTLVPGDLPDITVGSAEWADTTFDWGRVELNRSEYGLFRNGGTSLVILEQPDAGRLEANAGSRRIACGIVKERPEER